MRNKRLYSYIVNTFGLSKEIILRYVEDRLEDVIAKHVKSKLDSNRVESMILNKVTQCIKEGIPGSHQWYMGKTYFEDYLKKVVRSVIEEKLNEQYELEVKMIRKDKMVVNRID